jgi:hypothetical protein
MRRLLAHPKHGQAGRRHERLIRYRVGRDVDKSGLVSPKVLRARSPTVWPWTGGINIETGPKGPKPTFFVASSHQSLSIRPPWWRQSPSRNRRWRVRAQPPTIAPAQPPAAPEEPCPDSHSRSSLSSFRPPCSHHWRAGWRFSAPGRGHSGSCSASYSGRSPRCCSSLPRRDGARPVTRARSVGHGAARTAASSSGPRRQKRCGSWCDGDRRQWAPPWPTPSVRRLPSRPRARREGRVEPGAHLQSPPPRSAANTQPLLARRCNGEPMPAPRIGAGAPPRGSGGGRLAGPRRPARAS